MGCEGYYGWSVSSVLHGDRGYAGVACSGYDSGKWVCCCGAVNATVSAECGGVVERYGVVESYEW